jgi:hypothetical protein
METERPAQAGFFVSGLFFFPPRPQISRILLFNKP